MREIKFRAWDYNNERIIPWEKLRIEKDEDENTFSVVVFDGEVGDYFDDFPVMQYTGLKDKNGKEIYEGDILTSDQYPYQDDGEYNYHLVVEYIENGFCGVMNCVNGVKRGISHGIAELLEITYQFEVIGNIYENPELLEVSE